LKNTPEAPGRFQLIAGGETIETIFGTEGAQWHWQDGATVNSRQDSCHPILTLLAFGEFEAETNLC
jgi:hypothetical protein